MNFTNESLQTQIDKANYIKLTDDTKKYNCEVLWSSGESNIGIIWFVEEVESNLYLTSVDEDGVIHFFKKFNDKEELIRYIVSNFNKTFSLHPLCCLDCGGHGFYEDFNERNEEYETKTCGCCSGKILEFIN